MNKNKLFIIFSAVALSVLVVTVLIWEKKTINPEPTISDDSCLKATGVEIFDINEYNTFVETETKLPDNFVTADMLKDFGSFKGFVCNSGPNFIYYSYLLVGENDYHISLHVAHSDVVYQYTRSQLNVDKLGKNMTILPTEDTGFISINNIEYHYINGHLVSVRWQDGNVRYDMHTSNIDDYPPFSSSSIVGKLLSTSSEDQKNALKYFSEITQNKMQIE